MYLSETSLASCCGPGGKKSASSNSMKDTLGNPLIASKWWDGNASILLHLAQLQFLLYQKQ